MIPFNQSFLGLFWGNHVYCSPLELIHSEWNGHRRDYPLGVNTSFRVTRKAINPSRLQANRDNHAAADHTVMRGVQPCWPLSATIFYVGNCLYDSRLIAGNQRFVTRLQQGGGVLTGNTPELSPEGQSPFAIILGCSDSRVPAELVFDQGLGDLFVIRIAGNIVAPSQIGSVEFAAEQFATPLAVVLGHSRCGAVSATIQQIRQRGGGISPNLKSIVDRIRPAVEPLIELAPDKNESDLMESAVRANIRAATHHLRHGSAILERLVAEGRLKIVAAEYSLETGRVEFFDW